jgi:L-amino acid N-acyltransferase YncA
MREFTIRRARAGDARAMAELYAAVAAERDGIAGEPPVDLEERTAVFTRGAPGSIVAVAGSQAAGGGVIGGEVVGMIHIEASRFGFGEFGMLVARGWRGAGVGSALVQAAVAWVREHGLHKLCLEVFPHNTAGLALYRKAGFAEEGRRIRQYRRASGERWDSIVMGLEL